MATVPTDPTGRISHLAEMHRGISWKQPCRVATTANITIATDLNAGDTIDGVTLAAGDRVLVKDQTAAEENGIIVAGATPARAHDMDQDASSDVPASEVVGAMVLVVAGTVNAGKLFRATNATPPALGTDDITFEEFTSGTPGGGSGHEHADPEEFTAAGGTPETFTLVTADVTGVLLATRNGVAVLPSDIDVSALPDVSFDTIAGEEIAIYPLIGGAGGGGGGGGGGDGFQQFDQVKLTSGDLTTTNTSFVNATGLLITMTTGAHRCLITFTGHGNAGNVYATASIDLEIDGTPQGGTYGLVSSTGSDQGNFSFSLWTDVLAPGSHTFQIIFRNNAGNTTTIYASSAAPATLAVAETNLS